MKKRRRRCEYCADRYKEHDECATYLAQILAVIVSVIDVEAWYQAGRKKTT